MTPSPSVKVGPAAAGTTRKLAAFHLQGQAAPMRRQTTYGIYLAVVALLVAAWAEFKREDSLYLAAGSICGAGAVYLASHTAGLGCLILGAAVILGVRRARAA